MALITGDGFGGYTPEEWARRKEAYNGAKSNESKAYLRSIDMVNTFANYGGSREQSEAFRARDMANEDQYGLRGTIDWMNQNDARYKQADLATYFAQQAMGQGGPSVAQKQLQAGLDQATNNAMGIAASSRTNPAAAARAAIQAQGQMAAQTNQQAGILRAQEQLDAGNLAMQAGQGLRAQDLDSYGRNQAGQLGYRSAANDQAAAELQASTNLATSTQQNVLNNKTARSVANQEQTTAITGGVLNAAGAIGAGAAAASDKRLKKNVHDGDLLAQAFMDSLDAKGFEYKGDNVPQLGIMAQDMERTREGRSAVLDTPNGKAVSVPDATSRLLAAVANLNKRTKELESKKGGR